MFVSLYELIAILYFSLINFQILATNLQHLRGTCIAGWQRGAVLRAARLVGGAACAMTGAEIIQ
jgi:hypothetical protein